MLGLNTRRPKSLFSTKPYSSSMCFHSCQDHDSNTFQRGPYLLSCSLRKVIPSISSACCCFISPPVERLPESVASDSRTSLSPMPSYQVNLRRRQQRDGFKPCWNLVADCRYLEAIGDLFTRGNDFVPF